MYLVRRFAFTILCLTLFLSLASTQVPPNVSRDDGGDYADKLETLLSYFRTLAFKQQNFFPVGIVCDGVADDTAAIQAALTGISALGGRIDLPDGVCLVSSTLTYTGTSATSFTFGGLRRPGRGLTGTQLKWIGAAGGTILQTLGANNSTIRNLALTGNALAKYGIFIRTNQPASGAGSSGTLLEDLVVVGMTGANSAAVRVGDSTQQASEVWFNRVVLIGSGTNTAYGAVFGTGNVKNYSMTNCAVSGFEYGVVMSAGADGVAGSAGGSGYLSMRSITFGNNTLADIWHGNGGELSLDGWDSELSTRFLVGAGGSGPSGNTISNGSWTGATPSDDFVIDVAGSALVLMNNYFFNARSFVDPISGPKIRAFASSTQLGTPFRIVAIGNTYLNWKGVYAPLYIGTTPMEVAVAGGQYAVESKFEHAFPFDASSYHLLPFNGLIPSQSGLIFQPYPGPALTPGVTLTSGGESRQTVLVVDIDKAAWVDAALVQGIKWTTPAHTIIRDVICDTTEAYAGTGLTGTISLAVGINSNASAYLTGHDVKTAPVVKGGLEADRGVRLTQAGVNGGRYYVPSVELLGIFLLSSVGNVGTGSVTNLTSGHTRCTISYERLP